MKKLRKPKKKEYSDYYETYISKVVGEHIYVLLRKNAYAFPALLYDLPDDKWHFRYAQGKWSLAQVVMHLIDSERIFAYRALRIARGDITPLTGFNQNDFAETCKVSSRIKDDVINEYVTVRNSTLSLLEGLDEDAFERIGTMSDSQISVLALFYIIAGHEVHHMNVIQARYLS